VAAAGGRDGRPLWHERNDFMMVATAAAVVMLMIVNVDTFSAASLVSSTGNASQGLNVARSFGTCTLPFIGSCYTPAAASTGIHLGLMCWL